MIDVRCIILLVCLVITLFGTIVCIGFIARDYRDNGRIRIKEKVQEIEFLMRKIDLLEVQNKELRLTEKKYDELRIRNVTVTAYSLSKEECDDDFLIGAINIKVIPGYHCAVSRDLIYMLNRRIYIEGIGVYKVIDVMNKRFTSRLDLCMTNAKTCKEFGIKENIQIILLD